MNRRYTWIWSIVAAFGLFACAADELDGKGALPTDDTAVEAAELKLRICKSDADCPVLGVPCRLCADESSACPSVTCERHHCVASIPTCPEADPCATVRCAAGTHCDAGACLPDNKVVCGGFAGLPCPGRGQCVDDPSDTCDPKRGGADCSGLCTCVQNVACILGSHFDPSPSVCSCVPDAPSTGTCGGNTCAAGEYCCNASCGMCAPKGAACIQIACASPL
jgi:hypothetical protein